ncbi:MAG: hypothetical protein K2G02_07880 [Phocaeicola sp.]|nr:hypothetical protein [Phocaeicola sp.]
MVGKVIVGKRLLYRIILDSFGDADFVSVRKKRPIIREIPLFSAVEPVQQNVEPVTELIEVQVQLKLDFHPTSSIVILDEKKHTLIYEDKEILLAPRKYSVCFICWRKDKIISSCMIPCFKISSRTKGMQTRSI